MTAPSSLRLLRLEPARRRRLRRRRPDDRWAAVLAVGVVVGGWLLATCRSPLAPAADDAERLAHAREEARDNCLAAAFVAAGQPITAPWFQTEELRAALETSLVCAGDRGEGRRSGGWPAGWRRSAAATAWTT